MARARNAWRLRRALVGIATAATVACGGGGGERTDGDDSQPPGRLAGGEATVEVSGDVQVSATLDLRPNSIYAAAPGGMSLSYDDEAGNFLGVGGQTFTGTRSTSLQLSLTVTVGGTEPLLFISEGGECTIDVDRADATGVSGSFDCADLANSEASIDAVGTFSASA